MWKTVFAPATVAAVLLLACSGAGPEGDPIESLESTSLSPDYDATFWQQQAEQGTDTWDEAVAFCVEETDRPLPNCSVVLKTAFIQGLETALDRPFPEYPREGGGGSTGVPKEFQERLRDAEEDAEDAAEADEPDGR